MIKLSSIIVLVITFGLSAIYYKIDSEYRDRLRITRWDVVGILLIAAVSEFTVTNVVIDSIMIGYLLFESLVDLKIKYVYDIISYIVIVINIVLVVIHSDNLDSIGVYNYLMIPLFLLMVVMSRMRMIGFGDVIVYLAIAVYLVHDSIEPLFNITACILIANALFASVNLLKLFLSKVRDKHNPLTVYIMIGFIGIKFLGIA